MKFTDRLWLGIIYLLDYPFTFIGWIVWIIHPIDITVNFKKYKQELLKENENEEK